MRNNTIRIESTKKVLKEASGMSEKMKRSFAKYPLVLSVWMHKDGDTPHWWSCPFTPWRLFATFFVKKANGIRIVWNLG